MMGRITLVLSLLLATAIAFAEGGTSDASRSAFLAGTLVLVAASSFCPSPVLPEGRPARLALGGLTGLAVLTAVSGSWSPSPGAWSASTQLAVSYLALTYATARAAAAVPGCARLIAPGVLIGAVLVTGYGLLARALPDLVSADASVVAGGRLFAPIGYWNAMGLLAAIGLVTCAAVLSRPDATVVVKRVAVATTPLLGAALAMSYSRTAIAAAIAGLLVVMIVGSRRAALTGCALVTASALLGAASTMPFDAVRHGDVDGNEGTGWLVVLAIVSVVPVIGSAYTDRQDDAALTDRTKRALAALLAVVCLVPFAAALTTRNDAGSKSFGATAERLTETASNRAQYWSVAAEAFAERPVAGHGAGSFASLWLEHRSIGEKVQNAHSLWIETAAELGIAGLLLLALIASGVVLAAKQAGADGAALAGIVTTWALAASVDWHWQVPAVTAVALIATGGLLSAGWLDRSPTSAD